MTEGEESLQVVILLHVLAEEKKSNRKHKWNKGKNNHIKALLPKKTEATAVRVALHVLAQ